MFKANRSSIVDQVKINDIFYASSFHIGDSSYINAVAKVFAVQREKELFYGFEANYEDFPNFTEPIPIPPITENLQFNRFNANPSIHVSKVRIIGISTSSIFHIGNTKRAYLEARVHHTRQLEQVPENRHKIKSLS
ncbi:spore germination protein GerPE [Heyndrickxia vini]|uniref:Spore germination protein GerPE n=1 Tax=Heyndrickxia vini TaxID=1476025 RepID=A0ABX7DXP1_9BACI|nr:spore germination protein GerPE [Heyndrickxia vini]QQZ08259.1 spore germination protein GerPE [Heyndrickxia vini]